MGLCARQGLRLPVDVVELQVAHFPDAQAVCRKREQERPVAQVRRTVTLGRREQEPLLSPGRSHG